MRTKAIYNQKRYITALIIILLVQTGVLLFWANQKQGYFIDEVYSFGLSNSYNKPFIKNYDMQDNWSDNSIYHEYLTVSEDEKFSYESVYYNQTRDNHPPLFYFVLHSVCSVFPATYSKWMGIGINFAFYIICSIFLYLLARQVLKNEWLAILTVAIWGFSAGAISTAIYIRMYMLLTMFVVILAYIHLRMINQKQTIPWLIMAFAVTALGLFTQYFFVIFAFFLAAAYSIYLFMAKNYKQLFAYSAVMVGAVIFAVLIFPASINHLTGHTFVAETTRGNFLNIKSLLYNCYSYYKIISDDLFAGSLTVIPILAVAMFYVLLNIFKINKNKQPDRFSVLGRNLTSVDVLGLAVIVVTALTLLTVISISPMRVARYVYYMYPLIALCIVWIIYEIGCRLKNQTVVYWVSVVVFAVITALSYNSGYISFLYRDEPARIEIAHSYGELYCLYFNNNFNAPLTQDIRELEQYKGVYVTKASNVVNLNSILDNKDTSNGIIVYIDVNKFWSSGYDSKKVLDSILASTKFTHYDLLYMHGLSETYIVR